MVEKQQDIRLQVKNFSSLLSLLVFLSDLWNFVHSVFEILSSPWFAGDERERCLQFYYDSLTRVVLFCFAWVCTRGEKTALLATNDLQESFFVLIFTFAAVLFVAL